MRSDTIGYSDSLNYSGVPAQFSFNYSGAGFGMLSLNYSGALVAVSLIIQWPLQRARCEHARALLHWGMNEGKSFQNKS